MEEKLTISTDGVSGDDSGSQSRVSPRLCLVDRERKPSQALTLSAVAAHDANGSSGRSLEDVSAGGRVISAESYWEEGHDPKVIDGNLRRVRRYLRTARSLYEIQMHPKRPSAVLKMKSNSYGFKSGSTHDVLASLVSPIRSPQVLDSWSPLEIGIFEDAFERYGKDFHAIAQQVDLKLANKTVKDVIAFYYIWKKHGILAVQHIDVEDSDGGSSDGYYDSSMSAETLKLVEKLKRRQRCMKDYFSAAREVICMKRINQVSHRDVSLADFSLHRLAALRPALPATSNLRNPSILDTWTPLEIRVFELAMECYGKEEFDQVARMIGTKSCKEVIAFYYVWKKDPYYQVVKSRWEKKDPSSKKKSNSSTTANANTGAASTVS